MKKVILGLVVLFLAMGGSIGYYLYNKPHKNISELNADIIISDYEIFSAFEKNEVEAIKKFVTGDPVIQVTGIISEISNNVDTTATVTIQDKNKYSGNVSCSIVKNEVFKLKTVKIGDKITIKGQCSGMQELIDKEVVFLRCVVVQ